MKLYNIVKVYTSTVGTGTVTLGSAVPSFITFATAGVVTGSTVSYAIEDGNNREVGTGTYTSGAETLTRSVVTSTNSNNLITLSGNAVVFITGLAADLSSDTANVASTLVQRDGSGNFAAGAATLSSAVMKGSSSGSTTVQASATASGTLTLPAATDTLIGKATSDTLTNKTFDTAGAGNVFRINGTGITAVTGSGSVVLATSPTLATPNVTGSLSLAGSRVLAFDGAGYSSTNIAVGLNALNAVTTAVNNSAFGSQAMLATTSGNNNAAFGRQSLYTNTTGYENTAIGTQSLYFNSSGYYNVALGQSALESNTSGNNNSAIGYKSLFSNTVAVQGTAVGSFSLYDVTTGNLNTAIGYNTGRGITTGSKNTIIGANVTGLSSTLNNTVILADGDGNQRVYIDSSGNVGIGTSSPKVALDINGRSRVLSANTSSPSAGKGIEFIFYSPTDTGYILCFDRDGAVHKPLDYAASVHTFGISGSEKMRLNSSGNLLVGTTTSSARLTVSSGSGPAALITSSLTGTTPRSNSVFRIQSEATGRDVYMQFSDNVTNATEIGMISGSTYFCTGALERMRIDSSGNVSIGTSVSGSRLQVASSVSVGAGADSSYASGYQLTSTGAYGKATALDNTNLALMSNDALVNQPLTMTMSVVGNSTATSRYGYISINEYSTGNWRNLALQPFGGNVGIGTSSPDYRLSIEGANTGLSITETGSTYRMAFRGNSSFPNIYDLKEIGGNRVAISFDTGGQELYMLTAGSERMRINSSGNVIVGNASAAVNTLRYLDLYNTDTGASAGVITRMITSNVAGTSVSVGQIIKYKNGSMIFQNTETNSAANMQFGIGASEQMRILSTGEVGIGTPSPAARLDVRGGNGTGGLTSPSGTWAAQVLMNQDTNAYNGLAVSNRYAASSSIILEAAMGFNGSAAGYYPVFTIDGLGQAIFKPQRSEAMRIDYNGKVGIGTSNPESKLHIAGSAGSPSISAANQIVTVHASTNGNGQTLQIGALTTAPWSTWIQGSYSNNPGFASPISLQPAGGNVGIGTSSPAYQLQLSADSAAKPTTNTWTIASDSRLKTVKGEYQKGLTEICQVRPVRYEYNGKAGFAADGKEQVSILAQELMQVFPECVDTFKGKLEEDGPEVDLYNYNGHAITFALINAIKELKAEIDILKARN